MATKKIPVKKKKSTPKKRTPAKLAVKKTATPKVPRNFILCPKCRSKSKVISTDFGGLQTRKCKNGHVFDYDKWLADRAFWIGIV